MKSWPADVERIQMARSTTTMAPSTTAPVVIRVFREGIASSPPRAFLEAPLPGLRAALGAWGTRDMDRDTSSVGGAQDVGAVAVCEVQPV